MKHTITTILCALLFAACVAVPSVQTEALDFGPLVELHNEAVRTDAALEVQAKEAALAEAQALLDLVASVPMLTEPQLAHALLPVVERYDAYLFQAWPQLNPFERRYLTRTSDLARLLAGLPVTAWPR